MKNMDTLLRLYKQTAKWRMKSGLQSNMSLHNSSWILLPTADFVEHNEHFAKPIILRASVTSIVN